MEVSRRFEPINSIALGRLNTVLETAQNEIFEGTTTYINVQLVVGLGVDVRFRDFANARGMPIHTQHYSTVNRQLVGV